MPYRQLTDEEIREAALETMMHGDWFSVRDKVVSLFPKAETFSYHFASEYNDEGYDMRVRLDRVVDDSHNVLVEKGGLTPLGIEIIHSASGWEDYVKFCGDRWSPDEEDFFYDEMANLPDGPKLWLDDGDDGPIIEANVKTGPYRKFNRLFVLED